MRSFLEKSTAEYFEVIHPLQDSAEDKRTLEGLEPIRMSRGVKISLTLLRLYLITMALLLIYHVLGLAGI